MHPRGAGQTSEEMSAIPLKTGAALVSLGSGRETKAGCCGRGDGRRSRGGEDERAGPVDEVVAKGLRAGDEAARGAEGFAQGSHEDVWENAGRGAQAASVGPEHAEGVRFVDDEDGVLRGGDLRKLSEGRGVAVHAEKRLGQEEAPAEGSGAREDVRRCARVRVLEDTDGRSGEAAAVDEARVVGCIGGDQVVWAGQGRHDA